MALETAASIILSAAGVIVTAMSAPALWHAVKLHLRGRRVTGALVDWRYTFDQKWLRSGHEVKTRHYFPIVRFEAADGSQHRVVSSLGYEAKPDWPVGRPFAVRYDPADLKHATPDPPTLAWIGPAAFLAVGIALLSAGLSAS